jgi:hypothetical protein
MAALLWPQWAFGQMQPHRAEYVLRLGAAANAPRIGAAVQDIRLECDGWRLEREIKGEVPLTASWKVNGSSRLDSQERPSGDVFRYHTLQSQNGTERETHGRVQRAGTELRAEIVSPAGPAQMLLPSPTLMPIALMEHLIERLRKGSTAFPAFAFDAEGTGDAFLIDVTSLEPHAIRGRRLADKLVAVPGKSWPVLLSFTRNGVPPQKPLFTVSTQLFDSGVVDLLTVEAGMVTVTADLQALEMHRPPTCQ